MRREKRFSGPLEIDAVYSAYKYFMEITFDDNDQEIIKEFEITEGDLTYNCSDSEEFFAKVTKADCFKLFLFRMKYKMMIFSYDSGHSAVYMISEDEATIEKILSIFGEGIIVNPMSKKLKITILGIVLGIISIFITLGALDF